MEIKERKLYYADLSDDKNVSLKYQTDKVKVKVINESAHNIFKVELTQVPGMTTHVLRGKLSSMRGEG